jgi:integrase
MIADVLRAYGDDVAAHRKSARNLGYNIGSLLNWWARQDRRRHLDEDVPAIRRDQDSKRGRRRSEGAARGHQPLAQGIRPAEFRADVLAPGRGAAARAWLTRSEAARLVWAARRYQHMRRMILLGLYTGSRPGVILGLQWDQVDFKNGVMSRLRPGASEDAKKRAPKVRLGRRILAHLRRWRRLDGMAVHVCHFDGRQVKDPHTSWGKIVAAAGLVGVTPHTLRHTRATWMMSAGVPIWEAAGFLGMTVKTLERIYGHHAPNYQDKAANI